MKYSSPYQQDTFKEIWLKHFKPGAIPMTLDCFSFLDFVQAKGPIYKNVGGTNTKGIFYATESNPLRKNFKGKVFLIYDVPDYQETEIKRVQGLRHRKIPQYPGFLCTLDGVGSGKEYMARHLGKCTRSKLRNYQNRLDRDLGVKYKMIWGDISDKEYEKLFNQFHALLTKRFEDKRVANNNLDPEEWGFYKEVSLPMLRKKEAGLFVTHIEDRPVAITLLNFAGDRVFDVIRVFDIEFARYRLGSISLIHQLDWCIKKNFGVLDFSKGYYDYKKQWSTREYMFHYHIWYDSKNWKCNILALWLSLKFRFKFWARKHNLQESYHKIRYKLKQKD